jgi:hypothetical protein
VEDVRDDIPPLRCDNNANAKADADHDHDPGNGADPDGDTVAGPTVLAHVDLAKTASNTVSSSSLTHATATACARAYSNFTAKWIYPDLLADQIGQPNLTSLIQCFLRDQHYSDSDSEPSSSASSDLPEFYEKITLYMSAVATFHAPSDISGIGGMRYEHIRAVDSWRNGPG